MKNPAAARAGFGGDRPFNYFTYGAAAAEVELDVLTGDWQLLARWGFPGGGGR